MFEHLLLALAISAALGAPEEDPDDPEAASEVGIDVEEEPDDRRSAAVLPGAFYGPTTGLGLAAFGTITRPLTPHEDTWPSTLTAAAVGTTRKQASIAMWPTLYLGPSNRWVIEGEVLAEHFPTRFFGLGPRSHSTWQNLTRRQLASTAQVRRRVHPHALLGVQHRLAHVGIRDISGELKSEELPSEPTGDVLLGQGVSGEHGSTVHSLGVTARWDTRDNDQSARRGALADLVIAGAPRFLGSSHAFGTIIVDTRGYVPIAKDTTLALQWRTEANLGDVPFTSMATIGDDDLVRGLFDGRFRDHHSTAAQVEVRSPAVWRFRAVGFTGFGQVFRRLDDLSRPAPTWTAGGGLRFELDPQTRSTIRADFASGPAGTGFIFTFGEAL